MAPLLRYESMGPFCLHTLSRERERENESERENETYVMKLRALSTSASSLNTGMKGILIGKD